MTNFAKLHRSVVFNESAGKIIWQPRIGCWYDDKIFAGDSLPKLYDGKTIHEVYRILECSARLYEFNSCFTRIENPQVMQSKRELNYTDLEITYETPVGKQVEIQRYTPSSSRFIHLKWEVETEDELKVAAWREENSTWAWNQQLYNKLKQEIGDLGAPTMYMPRMNVQSLYIDKMGIENGIFAMLDWPDTTQAYFHALHESHDRLIDIINDSPIEIINFGENVHAATLPPDLFLKHHLPECQHRCERLHNAGKFVSSHWDGDCGPLLKYARETGLDGIEAITPRPQGDVTLEQVKEALGNEIFLIDGIPAIYFDEIFPIDVLVECTENIIDLFAPQLVLGISDEISSTGDIERIRIISDIVNNYNAKYPSKIPAPTR